MTTVIKEKDKEYHLKRLLKLSVKSLGEIPQLDEPTEEQLEYVNRRMRASTRSWEAYNK
jgi:hypothetical protein